MFHDPDADAELLDFGGQASSAGRARAPQVKYTYQGPYGLVLTGGFENPVPRMLSTFGSTDIDTLAVPTIAPCSVTGNTAAALPVTTACIGSSAFFDALKSSWPEMIGTARINNPWGHMQVGVVLRTDTSMTASTSIRTLSAMAARSAATSTRLVARRVLWARTISALARPPAPKWAARSPTASGLKTNYGAPINVPGLGVRQPAQLRPRSTAAWNSRGAARARQRDQREAGL